MNGRIAAVLATCVAAAAGCTRENRENSMDAQPTVALQRQVVGRFRIGVPVSSERAGSEYQLRWLAVREQVLFTPEMDEKERQGAFAAAWAAKVADAQALAKDKRFEGDVRGTIRIDEQVVPGRQGFLSYHDAGTTAAVMVEGLRDAGGVGLWMKADIDPKFEADARARMIAVGGAYRIRTPDEPYPAPGKDWLYLEKGVFGAPYAENEEAMVRFTGGALDGELEVQTESVLEVKKKGLIERFMETLGIGGEEVAGVTPVRSRRVKAGPFEGEELIIRSVEEGRLVLMWTFEGEVDSGDRPKIKIGWETKDTDQKAKLALWEQILGSFGPAKTP